MKKTNVRRLFKALRAEGVPFIVAHKSSKVFFRDYNLPEELIKNLMDLEVVFQVVADYHDDPGRCGWETTVTLAGMHRSFDLCDYDYSFSRKGPFRPRTSQYTVVYCDNCGRRDVGPVGADCPECSGNMLPVLA